MGIAPMGTFGRGTVKLMSLVVWFASTNEALKFSGPRMTYIGVIVPGGPCGGVIKPTLK